MDDNTLKCLIKYCYSGQIQITSTNIFDLFEASTLLRIDNVRKECVHFFKQQLLVEPDSCLDIYLLAEKYLFSDLMDESIHGVRQHIESVSKTIKFRQMDFKFLKRLLQSNELLETTEAEIFEAAMAWVKFRPEQRNEFIPEILKSIRLKRLTLAVNIDFLCFF